MKKLYFTAASMTLIMLSFALSAEATTIKERPATKGSIVQGKPLILETRPTEVASSQPLASKLTGMFAMNSGTLNLGAEYEVLDSDSTGTCGYILFSGRDSSSVKNTQFVSVGASIKAHYLKGPWNMSVAPGVGVSQVDVASASGTSQKTVFGPSVRWGALYDMNNGFSVGLENFTATNWFEKETASAFNFTNVIFKLNL